MADIILKNQSGDEVTYNGIEIVRTKSPNNGQNEFVDKNILGAIPTKVSQLENDLKYMTEEQLDNKVAGIKVASDAADVTYTPAEGSGLAAVETTVEAVLNGLKNRFGDAGNLDMLMKMVMTLRAPGIAQDTELKEVSSVSAITVTDVDTVYRVTSAETYVHEDGVSYSVPAGNLWVASSSINGGSPLPMIESLLQNDLLAVYFGSYGWASIFDGALQKGGIPAEGVVFNPPVNGTWNLRKAFENATGAMTTMNGNINKLRSDLANLESKVDGMEAGGGGSGGSAGAAEEVDILPETEAVFGYVQTAECYGFIKNQDVVSYIAGETYYVVFNGQTYECIAETVEMQGVQIVAIGDTAPLTSGTPTGKYPFNSMICGPEIHGSAGIYSLCVYTTFTEETTANLRIYQKRNLTTISWNNVTDKPFYSTEQMSEVLPQTELVFTVGESGMHEFAIETTAENETDWYSNWSRATITWDGEEYVCEPIESGGVKAVGDLGSMTDQGSTGEPFIIGLVPASLNNGTARFEVIDVANIPPEGSTDSTISHTVSISLSYETVKRLDAKFSPIPLTVKPASNDVILPSTRIPFYFDSANGAFAFQTAPTSDQMTAWSKEWTKCVVTWDGTEYVCKPDMTVGVKAVGNVEAFIGTGNNWMPFALICGTISGEEVCILADLSTPVDGATDGQTVYHTVQVTLEIPESLIVDPGCISDIDYEKQIINKPFGTIPSGTVLFDEAIDCQVQMSGQVYFMTTNELPIIAGGAYAVELDGTTYSVTAVSLNSGQIVMLANDGDSNGAGFFQVVNGYMPGSTNIASTQGHHTVKITTTADTVRKIDAVYLPDSVGLPSVTTSDNGKVLGVSNGVYALTTPASGLPAVAAADNGKVLRVVNGAWAAASIPNAEEVSF